MVSKYAVMIVDDEFLAREDLKNILKRRHPDFEVVVEAASSHQAWDLMQHYPNLQGVFLDVHLQTENERAGLDFAYAINRLDRPPWIVFVTGYSQTAVEAHRLHPAHYLLKPLDDHKLDEALDWIRKTASTPRFNSGAKIQRIEVRHSLANRFDEHERHTAFIEPTEIAFIAKNKAANTLQISLSNGKVLDCVRGTIKDWELRLSEAGFVKIHRSHLVNLRQVRSIGPRAGENEVYKIALKDLPVDLPVGPEYLELLKEKLKFERI